MATSTFRYVALSWALVLLFINASATNGEWLNLTNSNHITAIAHHGNTVWVGSRGGGLAKIDLATGNKTFYNKANSGLPSNQVEAIQVDAQNNIWIGTYDQGLAKFDGQLWEVFNTENSDLSRNDIYDVKTDSDGNIWIGTLFSISKYDGTTFYNYTIPGYTAATTLLVLAPDDIYTAWYNSGFETNLFHFNGTTIDTVPGIHFQGLYRLYQDSQERIWACYEGGVALKDGNYWVYFDSTNSVLPNAQTRSITEWKGKLLVGTDKGVYAYNDTAWVGSFTEHTKVSYITAAGNQLYVGTLTQGLFTSNGGPLQSVAASNSTVPENVFSRIFKDDLGYLTFKQNWGDLAVFQNNTWTTTPEPVGLGSYQHMTMAPDNSFWFCGYDSLFHLSGGNLQGWDLPLNGISVSGISTVAVAPDGKVYVGTYGKGFFTFDGTDWALYNRSNSNLSSNKIQCFAFVGDDVWIGTYKEVVQQVEYGGGIEVFDGSTFSLMHPDNSGVMSRYISHLQVHGDSVWIGGDGGFGLYHNGTFANYLYNNGSGSPLAFIKHMAINAQGEVFATGYNLQSEGIMIKWDGHTFEVFDGNNSPIEEYAFTLYDMGFDNEGNLWLLHGTGTYLYKEGGVIYTEETPLAMGDLQTPNTIKIYPNPVTTTFTVALPEAGGNIAIFNLMGAKVFGSTMMETDLTIDATEWPKGIYLYQVQTTAGFESGKFLVR